MSEEINTAKHSYSTPAKVLFWLLWAFGCLILFLFAAFLLITIQQSPFLSLVSALTCAGIGYLLWKAANHLSHADRPAATLFLILALAIIGIPLIATGGCVFIESMGIGNFRIAG
jgi:hypothetical protein